MSPDEIQDPVGLTASLVWWGLGAFLLIGLAIWATLWFTRNSGRETAKTYDPAQDMPRPTEYRDPLYALREEYLGRLDAIERLWRAGTINDRQLHLQLSSLIRGFADRRVGEPATTSTLSELRTLPLSRRLVGLIEMFYEPSFGPRSEPDSLASLTAAREVLTRW